MECPLFQELGEYCHLHQCLKARETLASNVRSQIAEYISIIRSQDILLSRDPINIRVLEGLNRILSVLDEETKKDKEDMVESLKTVVELLNSKPYSFFGNPKP